MLIAHSLVPGSFDHTAVVQASKAGDIQDYAYLLGELMGTIWEEMLRSPILCRSLVLLRPSPAVQINIHDIDIVMQTLETNSIVLVYGKHNN